MKSVYALIITIFTVFTGFGQSVSSLLEFNFGFEKVTDKKKLPDNWVQVGSGYTLKIDNTKKKSGNNSILIEVPKEKFKNSFGSLGLTLPTSYEGKEIELSAFFKLQEVSNGFAGLWVRMEGDIGVVVF